MSRQSLASTHYFRSRHLEGLEAASLNRAAGVRAYFPRREFLFAVGAGPDGRQFRYRNQMLRVHPEVPIIVQAGEPYVVRSPKPLDLSMLHVDEKLVRRYGGKGARAAHFPVIGADDAAFAKLIRRLHRAVQEDQRQAVQTDLLEQLLTHAFKRHAEDPKRVERERRAQMTKIQNHMQKSLQRSVPLSELAELSEMSVFQFVRVFSREMGLTPHAMLIQLRAHRARELLRKGKSASEAAEAAGFSDPSHLVRHFKRIFLTTPGAYGMEQRAALSR